jgi:alpha-1,6-mannosyltransferase
VLTVLDVNNFWSPTGGGVRRYELEKARVLAGRDDVRFVFALPGQQVQSERKADNVVFEHVASLPSRGEYRNIVSAKALREVIARHRPDVIEVGTPFVLPWAIRRAIAGLDVQPALVGFWHADFPRTYTGLGMRLIHPSLEPHGERFGWWWMRRTFREFDAIFVASRWVGQNLISNGLDRLYYTPLGVDTQTFHPRARDPELLGTFQAGDPRRAVLLFPHRFSEEKGLRNLLLAYELIRARVEPEPALVFAGTGPERELVEQAVRTHAHVHFVGYLDSREQLARHFASSDICPCLSKFETFGLSTAEAMASGLAVVAANEGCAGELVEDSGAGLTVPYNDTRALADAIVTLIEEGQLRERGAAGRAWAERLSWDATFERELSFYREILEHRSRGARVSAGFHGLA